MEEMKKKKDTKEKEKAIPEYENNDTIQREIDENIETSQNEIKIPQY